MKFLLALCLSCRLCCADPLAASGPDGIRFACPPEQLPRLGADMEALFAELRIAPEWIVRRADAESGTLHYTLATPENEYSTLDFKDRPEFGLHDETVSLPLPDKRSKKIATVSRKEILLALLQHGRLTEFSGAACSSRAVREHLALRQNIVAWAEELTWVWPDGRAARWNARYWKRGTPRAGVPLHHALADVFAHQQTYAIGCYTATKLVVVQGVLDYYRRVRPSPATLRLIEARLLSDREPLAGIEPARMWNFEPDFDPRDLDRPGKLLALQAHAMPLNFVPGDWIYLLNTDPASYAKTGYEGSNAIYLGRDKFDDYYNDHHHGYSYAQKLDEVYQWRNGVFSRVRDADKIRPLQAADIARLSERPAAGGLLRALRVTPYLFGYQALPELPAQ